MGVCQLRTGGHALEDSASGGCICRPLGTLPASLMHLCLALVACSISVLKTVVVSCRSGVFPPRLQSHLWVLPVVVDPCIAGGAQLAALNCDDGWPVALALFRRFSYCSGSLSVEIRRGWFRADLGS